MNSLLPEGTARRNRLKNKVIASSGDGTGLTADEFDAAADALLNGGLHPVAIGKLDPSKPDKPAGKAPWHAGVTGYNGTDPHPDRVRSWPADVAARIRDGSRGVLNLGMRMPLGGLGIDIDAYDGKLGLDTIREHEARLGALPPTYRITARPYAEGSGIRLFRVPDDWTGKTILKTDASATGHVELIQRHHRLAAVPPSHHHTGARYRVYDERTGEEVPGGVVPSLADWPKLPDEWLDALRSGSATKAGGGEATDEDLEQFAAEHIGNAQPWHLAEYIVPPVRKATAETRNAAFDALHEAARCARVGWYPWATAVAEIASAARDSYAQRGLAFDEAEFKRSVRSAVHAAHAENLPDLESRAERRLAQRASQTRAQRAMAPGGRWHPDTLWPPEQADSSAPVATARYRLVSASELARPIEPIRWLVRGIWPEGSAGVLAGDKKSMKTWNLQAIALAVAAGTALFDKYHVASPGPVLYLSGEGGFNTFANRHQAIAERYGITEMLAGLPFGAEFGVGTLTDKEFTDAVKRHLDELQPVLVILDPLYAYHPSDVEVTNLYERGPMLAALREMIGGEAALIVGDHFNKTAGGRLDLANIAQAGMAQWADSWILQKHRETPNLDENKYWLEMETGTRRGGGKHLEVDWTLERDRGDPDVILWTGVDWEARPYDAGKAESKDGKVAERIMQVVRDYPFELTETAVAKEVGGKRETTREVLNQLKVNGFLVVRNCEKQEGERMVNRDRVGPGGAAKRLSGSSSRVGTTSPTGNGFGEVVPDEGTSSERVADD